MSVNLKSSFKSSDGESFEMEEAIEHQSPTRTHSSFTNSLNRTLASQSDSRIKKLSLKYNLEKQSEIAYVSILILNAVERKVSELDLSINPKYEKSLPSDEFSKPSHDIFLPSELFTSKTLVKLTLGTRFSLKNLPKDMSLPALKTLTIDTIYFHDDGYGNYELVSGFPVLEELFVRHEDYQGTLLTVNSTTIKKLSVHFDCESDRKEFGNGYGMSFDVPKLVSFDYSNYALPSLGEMIDGDWESLVEARLDLRYSVKTKWPAIMDLLAGISYVENLDLTPNSADLIAGCVEHGLVIPVFDNLVNLSFGSKNKRGWKLLPDLLNKCPKLETLTIKDLDGYTSDDIVSISRSKVKVLRILGYRGNAQELEQLKSFIGKFKCLEKVQVDITQEDNGIISQARKDLLMLPRVSVTYIRSQFTV